MAGGIYDSLIGVTVVGMIFIFAVYALPNISYPNLLYVDEQQLRNTASNVLKAMLLGTGYPSDWGSEYPFEPDGVQRYGLAYSGDPSSYMLDPDKVQRLVEENPIGHLEYEKTKELLGLKGYGFNFRIVPPLKVKKNLTVENVNKHKCHVRFNVDVSSKDGRALPNAMVHATTIYSTKIEAGQNEENFAIGVADGETVHTDALGKCRGIETIETPEEEEILDVIVIFRVTVAGMATIVAGYQDQPPDNIADINMLRDHIILTIPYRDDPGHVPKDARWIRNILVYGPNGLTSLLNGSRTNPYKLTYGKGYKIWERTFENLSNDGPELLIFNFDAVVNGRSSALIVGPHPNWLGCRVLQYGSAYGPNGAAVSVERTVSISGMTYVAQLTLWKEFM